MWKDYLLWLWWVWVVFATFLIWLGGFLFLNRKGFTILINTWKRDDLLKQSIVHYTSCSSVDSIHIVWSEPDPPSDSLRVFLRRVIQSKSKDGNEIELKFDFTGKTVWTTDSRKSRIRRQMLSSQLMMMLYFHALQWSLLLVFGEAHLILWWDLYPACIGWINRYDLVTSLIFIS